MLFMSCVFHGFATCGQVRYLIVSILDLCHLSYAVPLIVCFLVYLHFHVTGLFASIGVASIHAKMYLRTLWKKSDYYIPVLKVS